MSEALAPSVGWGVLHLFCKIGPRSDGEAIVTAVKAAQGDEGVGDAATPSETQVVPFSVPGLGRVFSGSRGVPLIVSLPF